MSDSVTYSGVLPMDRATVQAVAGLLTRHRLQVGTRTGARALGVFAHAVLLLRFLLDAPRITALACDNAIGLSTCYRYVHEGLDVLAARAPGLRPALLAAHAAGHTHLAIDGTLIATDRCTAPGPTTRTGSSSGRKVDLWYSGKHRHHGGNVQVLTTPDGWPIWVSPVRPGREHDTTCARTHPGLLNALEEYTGAGHRVLADLGYEGERDLLTCPAKAPTGGQLDEAAKAANRVHNGVRARAEQGNAWLKNYRVLRKVTLCPWRIGAITAAVLVVLHLEHHRTT